MKKVLAFLNNVLEFIILAFFMLVYINNRLIKAFHPNINLYKFKIWYKNNVVRDFAIVFFTWVAVVALWWLGVKWFFAAAILIAISNAVGLLIWFIRHRFFKKD